MIIKKSGNYEFTKGINGPTGQNSFVMVDDDVAQTVRTKVAKGRTIATVGKGLNWGTTFVGLSIGMDDDIMNRGKTPGEFDHLLRK